MARVLKMLLGMLLSTLMKSPGPVQEDCLRVQLPRTDQLTDEVMEELHREAPMTNGNFNDMKFICTLNMEHKTKMTEKNCKFQPEAGPAVSLYSQLLGKWKWEDHLSPGVETTWTT